MRKVDDLKVLKNLEALIRQGFELQSVDMKGPSGQRWVVQVVESEPKKKRRRR